MLLVTEGYVMAVRVNGRRDYRVTRRKVAVRQGKELVTRRIIGFSGKQVKGCSCCSAGRHHFLLVARELAEVRAAPEAPGGRAVQRWNPVVRASDPSYYCAVTIRTSVAPPPASSRQPRSDSADFQTWPPNETWERRSSVECATAQ